jgi:para-aminobenzoate synthetase
LFSWPLYFSWCHILEELDKGSASFLSTVTMTRKSPASHILLLDAYDSFSNNLASLLETTTLATVHVYQIDAPIPSSFKEFLSKFDAVVVGPGPGTPSNPSDIGIVNQLWTLSDEDLIPVFGVCLGFQSLCFAHGAEIKRLHRPKHGIVSNLIHSGLDLFESIDDTTVTRYHSLYADLGHAPRFSPSYTPSSKVPSIEPLAWCHDTENGDVLMAGKHRTKPFWGVQYHPESICAGRDGERIIRNWWRKAVAWNEVYRRTHRHWSAGLGGGMGDNKMSLLDKQAEGKPEVLKAWIERGEKDFKNVMTDSITLPGISMTALSEAFRSEPNVHDVILLDSAAAPGRYSILGIVYRNHTPILQYKVSDSFVSTWKVGQEGKDTVSLSNFGYDPWQFIADFMSNQRAIGGHPSSPFWGGLMGYFSYEMGLATQVKPAGVRDTKAPPDFTFANITRSIVYDTLTGKLWIQSIDVVDRQWMTDTKMLIMFLGSNFRTAPTSSSVSSSSHPAKKVPHKIPEEIDISMPDPEKYKQKVRDCQHHIRAGDSYELCLTARTRVTILNTPTYRSRTPWAMYKTLRSRNAAPYSAYLSLPNGVSILSSSPERFLRWDREGLCQLRPIKGTVRKGPGMTREMAEEILGSEKERAENLMIVDLIRHDLNGVTRPGGVEVTSLMQVEEYETVYQLVSVVEGRLANFPHPPSGTASKATMGLEESFHSKALSGKLTDLNTDDEGKFEEVSSISASHPLFSYISTPSTPSSSKFGDTPLSEISTPSTPFTATGSTMTESSASSVATLKTPHTRVSGEATETTLRTSHDSPVLPNYTGLDGLKNSLPPGSMTGAPKMRSCELLIDLEANGDGVPQPRGIYSGVLGYLDVGGGGDWSVAIRSAWSYAPEVLKSTQGGEAKDDRAAIGEVWNVGAGGAITELSTPEGEWDEMVVKLESTLGALVG